MKFIYKLLLYILLPLALVAVGVIAGAYHWMHNPLTLPSERVDIIVPPGATPASVSKLLNQTGINVNTQAFVLMSRMAELDKKLKAGGYQVVKGDSPWLVVKRMANGDMTQRQITLVEGWNLRQIRAALAQHPDIKQTLTGVSDSELLERLGSNVSGWLAAQSVSPSYAEGLFFPDTYIFSIGSQDIEILQRAARAQLALIDQVWLDRQAGLPLKTPYEALILASIVEKETGKASDRARISGVFVNRLRINMPLQTDPTVIYGMGEAFNGKIRKQDLQTDTLWNTYTRNGLPPSPIASVGKASLQAALQPEAHQYLYFVAKGDGSSAFSSTLPEHNKNVSIYILGRKQ